MMIKATKYQGTELERNSIVYNINKLVGGEFLFQDKKNILLLSILLLRR